MHPYYAYYNDVKQLLGRSSNHLKEYENKFEYILDNAYNNQVDIIDLFKIIKPNSDVIIKYPKVNLSNLSLLDLDEIYMQTREHDSINKFRSIDIDKIKASFLFKNCEYVFWNLTEGNISRLRTLIRIIFSLSCNNNTEVSNEFSLGYMSEKGDFLDHKINTTVEENAIGILFDYNPIEMSFEKYLDTIDGKPFKSIRK